MSILTLVDSKQTAEISKDRGVLLSMQTPLNQTLAYAVSQLRADFVAFSSRKLEALGITQGLLYFVLYIGRHPGCTPSDLSAALHADSGHTTRSIHKLEETGFVIRKAHPTDRRASVLELTDKGRQTMEASRGMFAEWDAYLLEQVPEDQCRQLRELLQTLLPHLRYSPAIPDRPDGPPALRGRMPE